MPKVSFSSIFDLVAKIGETVAGIVAPKDAGLIQEIGSLSTATVDTLFPAPVPPAPVPPAGAPTTEQQQIDQLQQVLVNVVNQLQALAVTVAHIGTATVAGATNPPVLTQPEPPAAL